MTTGAESVASDAAGLFNWTDEQRSRYGGDWNMLRTLPEDGIHPETRERILGTRAELRGSSVILKRSFFRGDVIYVNEPERDFVLYPHYDDGVEDSADRLDVLLSKGYAFCEAEDWSLSERMQNFWTIESGRIVQRIVQPGSGVYPSAFRLMYVSKERFLEEEKVRNAQADEAIGGGLATDENSATLIDDDKTRPQRLAVSLTSTKERVKDLSDFPVDEE